MVQEFLDEVSVAVDARANPNLLLHTIYIIDNASDHQKPALYRQLSSDISRLQEEM